ncbi:kinase-like protein [Venturia nashicola]|nr:kinase-like protein [Venturia nashicola]
MPTMADPNEEKYEVLEKIGHGSFGVIHKVRRKSDGLVLCRKEISYNRMSQKEREQLQAELSILSKLKHQNIVEYIERDHRKDTQDLHLYMEFCGGGDLGQVIKRLKHKNQYAEEEFVWSIFSQIVTALYRCHYGEDPPASGANVMGLGANAKPTKLKSKQAPWMVLHRDIKPENVFLNEQNNVKLGDFGLSKILQSHDFASTYVGTPYYMSPEICAAERYSLYSDIWSLGCLLYELCAKEPPFNARTHIELFQKIKSGRISPIPPVYSHDLQKVINSCLQVNPNARPDTSQLLNLPIVKLMRKEQEIVEFGHRLRREKDAAERKLGEAEERMKNLEAALRPEIESSVRREWEVKARLEIDRQVAMEVNRMEKIFEGEVLKRMEQQTAAALPRSSTPSAEISESKRVGPAPTSQESNDADSSDFPSGTDISSLSIESPPPYTKPVKRTSRTPFARAHTLATNAVAVASPKDVQMADPSPMSIASLSLSPRKNQAHQRPAGNIFAAAEERWRPTNASSISTPTGSDAEDSLGADDEDEEDDLPVLPSPTRDPFKQLSKRPMMGRQKTMPVNTNRLAKAPTLFAPGTAANVKRPTSAVPVVATSPARRGGASPTRPRSLVMPAPGGVSSKVPVAGDTGSPVRKTGERTLKDNNSKPNSRGDGLLKTALSRNGVQGRSLVELQQARAGGIPAREKPISKSDGAVHVAVKMLENEPPVWDPEQEDEMPSPFLVGAGLQITPNASKILQKWNLPESFWKQGAIPSSLTVHKYSGEILAQQTTFKDKILKRYGAPFIDMHRADLQIALVERAKELGVQFFLGQRVDAIDFDKTTVKTVAGKSYSGDLIVAADGLWSKCRELFVGRKDEPLPTGDLAYRIVLRTSDLNDEKLKTWIKDPECHFWAGPGSHAVGYSLKGGDMYNLVLLCPDSLPTGVAKQAGSVDEMKQLFVGWDPILTSFLNNEKKCQAGLMTPQTWSFYSCHPMLPYLAQGANSSLEDGAVLGLVLGKVKTKDQLPGALRMYESLRKKRGEAIVRETFKQRHDFHMPNGPEQEARDKLFLSRLGKEDDIEEPFPSRWTCPVVQPWLYGYDADNEVDSAIKQNPEFKIERASL